MKELSLEKMENLNGGISIAAFTCGLGIVAVCSGGWWFGEMTAIACITAFNE